MDNIFKISLLLLILILGIASVSASDDAGSDITFDNSEELDIDESDFDELEDDSDDEDYLDEDDDLIVDDDDAWDYDYIDEDDDWEDDDDYSDDEDWEDDEDYSDDDEDWEDDWDGDDEDYDEIDDFSRDFVLRVDKYLNNISIYDYDYSEEYDAFDSNPDYMTRYDYLYNLINSTYPDYEDMWDVEFFKIISPDYLEKFYSITSNQSEKYYEDLYDEIYEVSYAEGVFDSIPHCVSTYIMFFESQYNNLTLKDPVYVDEMEYIKDYNKKFSQTYAFVNESYSGYGDYFSYDFFKIMCNFYYKSFFNSTDNQSEEYLSQLYDEFMKFHSRFFVISKSSYAHHYSDFYDAMVYGASSGADDASSPDKTQAENSIFRPISDSIYTGNLVYSTANTINSDTNNTNSTDANSTGLNATVNVENNNNEMPYVAIVLLVLILIFIVLIRR